MLPHQSLRELAYGVRDAGIKTVQFPGDVEPSGAVRAALAAHAARTGRKIHVEAAAPAQSQAEKEARSRKWGTALLGN